MVSRLPATCGLLPKVAGFGDRGGEPSGNSTESANSMSQDLDGGVQAPLIPASDFVVFLPFGLLPT